jgi:hypothetical protein
MEEVTEVEAEAMEAPVIVVGMQEEIAEMVTEMALRPATILAQLEIRATLGGQ